MVEDLEQTPEGRPRRDQHGPGPMATDREISCPSAGKSVSAYREVGMSASTGLALCLLLEVIGTALLVARPVDRQVRAAAMANRDIMLCLDVSGSMIEFDAELVDKFSQMVQSFDGERIAMSIWNRTSAPSSHSPTTTTSSTTS